MSPAGHEDTRDRVIALEVKVENLREDVHALTQTVGELRDALQQGKGAWWLFMGAAGFAGFLLSLAVKFIPYLGSSLPR